MEYRPLGKTGLQVSVLGYGAAPLGGVFGEVSEAEGIGTVHAALDAGINYVDVAPFYGVLKAETLLGKALKTVPRDRYILSTKVGRYDSDVFDFSAERVTRSVDESLQRLNVEHIDLILCHDIEFVDINQVVNEAIPALRKVQATGKVRFVGFSGLPLAIYPKVMDHVDVDAIITYCHYALNDDTLNSLTPYLQAKQVGIINASPLGMGLLTDNSPPVWHPAGEEIKAACARAATLCRERGANIATLGLQYALANPNFSSTLSGIGNRRQLEENLACVGHPPDPELLKDVLAILQPIHNRTWLNGRPENNESLSQ
jgi:L-galactose dehydrogenase